MLMSQKRGSAAQHRDNVMTEFEVRTKFGAPAMLSGLAIAKEPAGAKPVLSQQALEIAARFSDGAISPRMVAGLLRLSDFIAVFAIGFIAYRFNADIESTGDLRYLLPLAVAPFLAAILIQAADGYNAAHFHTPAGQAGRIVAAWTLVFAGFAVSIFFFKAGSFYSRAWFASWYLSGIVYFLAIRTALSFAVTRWYRDGRFQRRAVIVGGGASAAELIRSLESSSARTVQICGIF